MTKTIVFPGPVCVFVVPSAKIVVANTLRDYSANLCSRTSFIGGIAALLILSEARNLIANGEFWRIDTVVISLAGILG